MKHKTLLRFIPLFLTLCLLVPMAAMQVLAAEPGESEAKCVQHGDVNGDGKINLRDAIDLLRMTALSNAEISSEFDFNDSGTVDVQDAIYILYNTLGGSFKDTHALKGTIHEYYDPQWVWSADNTAMATLKCACGKTVTLTMDTETPVTVVANITEPSCVTAGVTQYTATVTYDGKTFENVKTDITKAASGHQFESDTSCELGRKCVNCSYEEPALGHNWVEDAETSKAATCKDHGVQGYKCERCHKTKTEQLEGRAEHTYVLTDPVRQEGCEWKEQYQCSVCGDQKDGETYYEHTFTAKLTKEASCSEEGIKTLTCVCGHTETEPIGKNGVHTWGAGVTNDGITTYTCSGCGATKTAICAEGKANVTKEALAENEVNVSGVAVALDETTVENLSDGEATIQVTKTDAQSAGVSSELAEQIGDNPVYNITLTSGEDTISGLAGQATVSLPYELQSGDDVDCIDIWYIDGSGEPRIMKGKYSNGYVTFTTNHFSYYTVTRLTPAQRCEKYGHAIFKNEKTATCTHEGYLKEICQRCGHVQTDKTYELLKHRFVDVERTAATCEQEGSFQQACSVCHTTISGTIPALGHNWKADEKLSREATCTEAGVKAFLCANENCNETRNEELPALGHDFGEEEEQPADCTNKGSKFRKCSRCDFKETKDTEGAKGHAYEAVFAWSEDHTAATVTLTCRHDKQHTKILTAVVTKKLSSAPCTGAGEMVYTATAAYNKQTYTDTYTQALDSQPHQPGADWQSNANQHFKVCEACEEKLSVADHVWGEKQITKESTCTTAGEAVQSCTVCSYQRTIQLPATGAHQYVDGVCKDCGFVENSCDHIRTHDVELDLSGYGICEGAKIYERRCACGEKRSIYFENLSCDMKWGDPSEEILPDGQRIRVFTSTCKNCGLQQKEYGYYITDPDTCHSAMAYPISLLKNGEVIASGNNLDGGWEGYHVTTIPVEGEEVVDLGELGLCGGKLIPMRCHCGEVTNWNVEDQGCSWMFNGESEDGTTRIYVCDECGAVRKMTDTESDAGICLKQNTQTIVFEVGGKEVHRYTNTNYYENHNYEVAEYKLDGTSCEDGVYVKQVCQDCKKVFEQYATYHVSVSQVKSKVEGSCCDMAVQMTCACGAEKHFTFYSENGQSCRWMSVDEETLRCKECGTTKTAKETVGPKNDKCQVVLTTQYTYTDKDGKVIASGESRYTTTRHNEQKQYELKGKSCEDGVIVTTTCQDCGYNWKNTYNHHATNQTTTDLKDLGLCGGKLIQYSCPCGQEADMWISNEQCEWQYLSGDANGDVLQCRTCKVIWERRYSEPEKMDSCREKVATTYIFRKGDQVLLEATWNVVRTNHRSVFTFTNGTCGGEYRFTETCLDCGFKGSGGSGGEGHGTWPVERKWVSQGQLCGDLELVTFACPCGQEVHQQTEWRNGACRFENYIPTEEGYQETCTTCGAVMTVQEGETIVVDACHEKRPDQVTITRDQETVCSYTHIQYMTEHQMVYSFVLDNETCAEGFTVIGKCVNCSQKEQYHRSGDDCENVWYCTAREVLYGGDDICSPIVQETYGCACGSTQEIRVNTDGHAWTWYPDGGNGYNRCDTCGLERRQKEESTQIPNSCKVEINASYQFSKDNQPLVDKTVNYTTISHLQVASFDMEGTSCTDGYYVFYSCARCKKSLGKSGRQTGHNMHTTEYYELADLGLCGGTLRIERCACGEYQDISHWDSACNFRSTGMKDSVTGLEMEYCDKCDTYRVWNRQSKPVSGSCKVEGTYQLAYIRGNERILDLSGNLSSRNHRMAVTSVTFADPAQGCEGGYHAKLKCLFCEETSSTNGNNHSRWIKEYHALEELYPEACGGYVAYSECCCAEESDVSYEDLVCDRRYQHWSETDAEGRNHNIEEATCQKCGLVQRRDYYEVQLPGSCDVTRIGTTTLSANGKTLGTWETKDVWQNHTYERVYTLKPGAASCTDGLMYTATCKLCNDTYTGGTYGSHNFNRAEEIDLAQYGSLCGAALVHYVCPCRQMQKYDFAPETLCDMDKVRIDNFVDGCIHSSQYTTEGWVSTYSYSYLRKCAVTHPETCGLNIRMSEYYMKEGCSAVEYQIWQLGYDEETGTCMKEIVIPTGERHAFHSYDRLEVNGKLASGAQLQGYEDRCPDCGSYYRNTYETLAGRTLKEERIAVNTLNNGERKSWSNRYEYGLEYGNYRYVTLNRTEFVNADDSIYWDQYEYTYDFARGCWRTTVYTNSRGERSVWEGTAHHSSYHTENIVEPTCTQYGQYDAVWKCVVCGQEESRYTYDKNPANHDWIKDYQTGIYTCATCGLESIRGSSGVIVLEDMTDKLGGGADYVVGYWNRDNLETRRYVSVLMKDVGADEDDEIVLTGIEFTELTRARDGINAVRFNREAVWTAAKAAVAEKGYEGGYVLRFTFVPINYEDTLDYAITFDNLSV